MTLRDLYFSIDDPDDDSDVLLAKEIPDSFGCRIARDREQNPTILLPIRIGIQPSALKNYRYSHLEVKHNVTCKISINNNVVTEKFTLLKFVPPTSALLDYFLSVVETIIQFFRKNPTAKGFTDTINAFVEIFRNLTEVPRKSIQGLWAEMFVIERSRNPSILIDFWHCNPDEKFDFNAGQQKLEVKSTASDQRIHTFSAEQLNPPDNNKVIIASVHMRPSTAGVNIHDLIQRIRSRIPEEELLLNKLVSVVHQSLGNSVSDGICLKFDYQIASESLKYFRHEDIRKIERIHIPEDVSEVKYKSNLSSISPVQLSSFPNSSLFGAIA
jgi:hypothetical protein